MFKCSSKYVSYGASIYIDILLIIATYSEKFNHSQSKEVLLVYLISLWLEVIFTQKKKKRKCIMKGCTLGRWNQTTRILHRYRFEVCTPHQRRSSTLIFSMTQVVFEPTWMWIDNTTFDILIKVNIFWNNHVWNNSLFIFVAVDRQTANNG